MMREAEPIQKSHFSLRDYQTDNLKRIRELYDSGENRLMNVLATGLGKTVIFAHLPEVFPEIHDFGMLVLVHRDELVDQAVEKIRLANPSFRVGIEKANMRAKDNCDVIVASVQSVGRKDSKRLMRFRDRIFAIITDEAHHAAAKTYKHVYKQFGIDERGKSTNGIRRLSLGYTATPNRSDGKGLISVYDEVAANYNLRWAVQNGWLVDIKAYRVRTNVDISNVGIVAGDFNQGQLDAAINVKSRNQEIVSAYKQHVPDESGIIFCSSVAHAHELQAEFNLAGISCISIDGETDKELRHQAVTDFKRGKIKVLTNFGVFTEGFDAPNCSFIGMARPTKSGSLYAQMIGRGTRPIVDVNYDEIGDRLKAIAESEKPQVTILDFEDVAGKHKLVNAVQLAGLKKEFDSQGKKIFTEVIETIEKLEKENPDRPFRDADSFEEVETMAEEIDIWQNDVGRFIRNSSDLRSLSRFRWWRLSPDSVSVDIPESRQITIRVDRDPMGRYTFTRIRAPFRDKQTKQFIPRQVTVSDKKANTLEEAVAAVDKMIVQQHGEVMWKMEHSPSWGKGDATQAQKEFLKALGVRLPADLKLTKADASMMIDAAKAKKKNG
jgi:superfamily II DNA or RNA helicase